MPAAPAAPPATASQVGTIAPSGKGEIHVGADGGFGAPASAPIKPAVTPKPAAPEPTAREGMESALTKRIKPGTGIDTTPENPMGTVPADQGEAKPPTDGTDADSASGAEPSSADSTTDQKPDTGSAKPAGKPKVNPWKLVDEHKAARAKAETEIAELKKLVPNAELRKQELAEVEQVKARNKELEDEIRYVNYSKSPEFKTKYQEPYEKAWSKAMSELKEITIANEDGSQRAVSANDLLEIVNLPLGKAREMANKVFGEFADDVMAHRKEIKNLFEAQATALEEARTKGAEREKKQANDAQTQMKAIQEQVADTWTKANESATKDEKYGKYFVPIEGDQEGNLRLAKGFELVDRAFRENPMDPKLTPEERASVIKRHAAVRNRAAAFGRALFQLQQKEARISELEKELAQFKSSTPETGGTQPAKTNGSPMSARDQMEADLAKRIRPGTMVR